MSNFGTQQAERVLADVWYINMSLDGGANARKLTSDRIIHHRTCFHPRSYYWSCLLHRKTVIYVLYTISQQTFTKSFSLVFHKLKFTGTYIYELWVVGGNTAETLFIAWSQSLAKVANSFWIKSVKICHFETLWKTAFFSRVLLRNEKMSLNPYGKFWSSAQKFSTAIEFYARALMKFFPVLSNTVPALFISFDLKSQ